MIDENIMIDDFVNSPIVEINQVELKNQPIRTDLKSTILSYLNVKQISDKSYVDILKSLIVSFLTSTTEISNFKNFFKYDFDYYFKLMFIEVVKNSSSDVFQILIDKKNKQENILIVFKYFESDISNNGIIIKNIFKDYFDDYLLTSVFKSTNHDIEINNIITNHTNANTHDLQYLINSRITINEDITLLNKVIFDFSKNFSNQNTALLNIILYEMRNTFANANDQKQFNLILSRAILNSYSNINTSEQLIQFLSNLLKALFKEQFNTDYNYLSWIVTGLKNSNISHPYALIKLINFVISKGSQIINNNKAIISYKDENNKKDIDIAENTQKIKIQHEREQRALNIKKNNDNLFEKLNNSDDIIINEPIYVNNIGLILFHLFIPTYFKRLNLLDDEGEFIDLNAKYKAVHLLQILVSDSKYDEHELVLNKILCNLNISDTIPMELELNEEERNLAMELNKVVLQRWEKMSNSSIEHFRAAFLMRDGRLNEKENGWYLTVEKRGYDIILSSIPWAFSVVKFKWMPKFLYTEWI
jgi:hypothetical protein